MTNRQKEVLKRHLSSERRTLKELERVYAEASREIEENIKRLMESYDITGLRSKIYQAKFQKALKSQIDKTLEHIQSGVYQSIEDYRTRCYEDGFIGAVYDMQGQGVPLIFPIDPEKMVRAISIDSKLSKSLYDTLGISLNHLKRVVREEISRCIAQGLMYDQVATRIDTRMNTGRYNASRIARTEGQRVVNEATYQAQLEAKARGADVVKQWCSVLDNRTRPTHRRLNGQIREINEYFEVNGRKALYPSGFGIPSEDINCRCTLLQRARWSLDKEGDGIIRAKNYTDFKKKYKEHTNA